MTSFDQDWDEIVLVEENKYQAGFVEGREAARFSDVREEGRRAGFLKGFAYGLELGFVEQCAVSIKESASRSFTDEQTLEMNNNHHRVMKRMSELHDKSAILLDAHMAKADIDYDEEIRHIRSLYKQSGSLLGTFPPTLDNISSTKVPPSADW
jgi:hypothetical protein